MISSSFPKVPVLLVLSDARDPERETFRSLDPDSRDSHESEIALRMNSSLSRSLPMKAVSDGIDKTFSGKGASKLLPVHDPFDIFQEQKGMIA